MVHRINIHEPDATLKTPVENALEFAEIHMPRGRIVDIQMRPVVLHVAGNHLEMPCAAYFSRCFLHGHGDPFLHLSPPPLIGELAWRRVP